MVLHGSGIRDISRVLRISVNTLLKTIRRHAAQTPDPTLPARLSDAEFGRNVVIYWQEAATMLALVRFLSADQTDCRLCLRSPHG